MEQHQISAEDTARRPVSREQAEDLVVATITRHAESVLRLARRHSICADDAQDAYQRALEIFLRHAHRLDPDRAGAWLHTVAKHEAMAVRRARARTIGAEEVDFDTFEARTSESPEERVLSFEHLTRSAEALQRLKPNEVRALWLKAAGNSYAETPPATRRPFRTGMSASATSRTSSVARAVGRTASTGRTAPTVPTAPPGRSCSTGVPPTARTRRTTRG